MSINFAPKKVKITPDVSVLAVLRHLNYKPWYALAEFIDNSIDSFTRHKAELLEHHGADFKLIVEIDIDSSLPARITIRDNAAGIYFSEFDRAFRPAAIPPDRSGLAEFGMGMKSASCWFSPIWSVRTSAFGEEFVRTIKFDIENIVNGEISELEVQELATQKYDHYTEIILENIFRAPKGNTVNKIKEHLTDIYRVFIREGVMDLYLNGENLSFKEVPILNSPHYHDMNGISRQWRKEIEFDFGNGLSIHGFAALRQTASTSKAGFSLFRRGRVIQGSGDEGYRPSKIFGGPNSYAYQRLFGELHLEGFEVSHTKDGFRWDENEEPFLELLKEHLDRKELPLLKQAQGFRVRETREKLEKSAEKAVGNTAEVMKENLPSILPTIAEAPLVDTPSEKLPESKTLASRELMINFRDEDWLIRIELTDDPSVSEWLGSSNVQPLGEKPRQLDIRVSIVHPFMVRFAQVDAEDIEALLRVAAALALAEVLAQNAGVRRVATIRRNINDILLNALSDPSSN